MITKEYNLQDKLINKIIDIYCNNPNVAILMSGMGSNAEAILSNRKRYNSINISTIVTDKTQSNAKALSEKYNLKYFLQEGGVKTEKAREEYFTKLGSYLTSNGIDTLLYAGFMKISTKDFVQKFPGINIHPADLTIKASDGKPKYIGMDVVNAAVNSGDSFIRSTAHVVESRVDCGQPIMLSRKLPIDNLIADDINNIHEKLKISCEHDLFPKVIEMLTQGKVLLKDLPYDFPEDL